MHTFQFLSCGVSFQKCVGVSKATFIALYDKSFCLIYYTVHVFRV